jgi:hypothetical protein
MTTPPRMPSKVRDITGATSGYSGPSVPKVIIVPIAAKQHYQVIDDGLLAANNATLGSCLRSCVFRSMRVCP